MDPEKGEATPRVSKINRTKTFSNFKKIVVGSMLAIYLLAVMFGMGVLGATYAEKKLSSEDSVTVVAGPELHHDYALARRDEALGASYPISTKTALSTLYSVSYFPTHEVVTEVETVTGTTYVTVPNEVHVSVSVATIESSSEYCEIQFFTMTESYTITITPNGEYSATSDALPEATVTGNPETVTDTQTGFTLTNPLPDATISGNPETVTETQTDFSLTHPLPEATVTGNPETVTNTQTDFTLTNPLPDATVSGNPETVTDIQLSFTVTGIHTTITISDIYPPGQDLSTVQGTVTSHKSLTTMTVTEPCEVSLTIITVTGPYEKPSTHVPVVPVTPTSTSTTTVYEPGTPWTSTTTVRVPVIDSPPYPTTNNTTIPGFSGTIPLPPGPSSTTPAAVSISAGTKKPEPRGWGGTSGTTNLSCTIMLVAIMMFVL
ncbi:uncharacterized protein QYS62_005846 [Fusarium acuminatum]|uniref:Uncharacterized protein n=1 Tax=Fusarium acuminatum TaxID=5515 RepID=A0ABZ2WVW1_9HYPO